MTMELIETFDFMSRKSTTGVQHLRQRQELNHENLAQGVEHPNSTLQSVAPQFVSHRSTSISRIRVQYRRQSVPSFTGFLY
jgi:hypothetical protein